MTTRKRRSDPDFSAAFAERLALILSKRKLAPHELAKALGVKRQQIGIWLSGDVAPTLESAAAIAEALDVPIDALVYDVKF